MIYGAVFNMINVPFYFDVVYDSDDNKTILQIFVTSNFTELVRNSVRHFETKQLEILVSPGSHKRLVRELVLSLYKLHNKPYKFSLFVWSMVPMFYYSNETMISQHLFTIDEIRDMWDDNFKRRSIFVLKIRPNAKELIIEKRILKSRNLDYQLRKLEKEISVKNIVEEVYDSFYYPAVAIHWGAIMDFAEILSDMISHYLNADYHIIDKTNKSQ